MPIWHRVLLRYAFGLEPRVTGKSGRQRSAATEGMPLQHGRSRWRRRCRATARCCCTGTENGEAYLKSLQQRAAGLLTWVQSPWRSFRRRCLWALPAFWGRMESMKEVFSYGVTSARCHRRRPGRLQRRAAGCRTRFKTLLVEKERRRTCLHHGCILQRACSTAPRSTASSKMPLLLGSLPAPSF